MQEKSAANSNSSVKDVIFITELFFNRYNMLIIIAHKKDEKRQMICENYCFL